MVENYFSFIYLFIYLINGLDTSNSHNQTKQFGYLPEPDPIFFTHDILDNTQIFRVGSGIHYPLDMAIPKQNSLIVL